MARKKKESEQMVEKQGEVKKEEKTKIKAEKKEEKAAKAKEKEKKAKEEKQKKEEKKKVEKKVEKKEPKGEERILTINLREAWKAKRDWRAVAAVKVLKKQLQRHTKREVVKIDRSLNEKIWERGIEKPPRRVKVRVVILEKEAIDYPA